MAFEPTRWKNKTIDQLLPNLVKNHHNVPQTDLIYPFLSDLIYPYPVRIPIHDLGLPLAKNSEFTDYKYLVHAHNAILHFQVMHTKFQRNQRPKLPFLCHLTCNDTCPTHCHQDLLRPSRHRKSLLISTKLNSPWQTTSIYGDRYGAQQITKKRRYHQQPPQGAILEELSARHLFFGAQSGQNHFPLGAITIPTHSKWNHSCLQVSLSQPIISLTSS